MNEIEKWAEKQGRTLAIEAFSKADGMDCIALHSWLGQCLSAPVEGVSMTLKDTKQQDSAPVWSGTVSSRALAAYKLRGFVDGISMVAAAYAKSGHLITVNYGDSTAVKQVTEGAI